MPETLLVNLPPLWAARLGERARAEGLSVEQLISRLLARSDDEIAQLARRRLDEMARRPTDSTLH